MRRWRSGGVCVVHICARARVSVAVCLFGGYGERGSGEGSCRRHATGKGETNADDSLKRQAEHAALRPRLTLREHEPRQCDAR
jgi:hypothetical protein